MPVILKKNILHASVVGIWEIKEDESYFMDRIKLTEEEKVQLSAIKGKRRVHWLCSRHLLHLITNETRRRACLKDEFGKPHLHDSQLSISFSHSDDLVAVGMSRHLIGIDIQARVEKITRIRHKFVNEDELPGEDHDEITHLHWIWGAKEAAFKAYGRKQIDFLKNMKFKYDDEDSFHLSLSKPGERSFDFTGKLEQWGEYHFVYLIENSKNEA
ncbi:MAG: 4'-phosphopantetheinyl transferase superfamily protein [Saprospiraceae bacterium]|nr:4'-phosphopantetheinyl transferase superfamily protein [Saprospiraceae bacterium]